MRRRGKIFQLVAIGLVAGAISTSVAVFVPWLPAADSIEGGRIGFTFWFATVIALVVFSFVMAVLIYAFINFRVREDDWSADGPPTHGNTRLEVVWTTIPFLLVTAISIVSAIVLHDNGLPGKNPLRITVIGQQFAWTFQYPNGQIYPTLHLPQNQKVLLTLTSRDVIHSFWVPEFYQKQDAVPGMLTHLVITPTKQGVFPVICVELCGLGHALMRSEAIVMSPAAYEAWYKAASGPTTGTATPAEAIAEFKSSGCAACHTFSAIPGADGKVGPSLDDLSSAAAANHESLTAFITQAITDPYKYIPPGYAKGVMPATFGTSIPKPTLTALVNFIAQHTH